MRKKITPEVSQKENTWMERVTERVWFVVAILLTVLVGMTLMTVSIVFYNRAYGRGSERHIRRMEQEKMERG